MTTTNTAQRVRSLRIGNVSLKPGDSVELTERTAGERDGDFLRIKNIFRHSVTGRIVLRGWRICRVGRLRGLINTILNETYINIQRSELEDGYPQLDDGFVVVNFHKDVLHIAGNPVKRTLVITNRPYPDLTGCPTDSSHEAKWSFKTNSRLVCRWVWTQYPQTTVTAWPKNATLRRVSGQEADIGADDDYYALADTQLLEVWRGRLPTDNTISFVDFFCGAGGCTHGALKAGLDLHCALDNNEAASLTYLSNVPEMQVVSSSSFAALDESFLEYLLQNHRVFFHIDAYTFLQYASGRPSYFMVDVLHISPPCQFYSSANTSAGYKDPDSEGGKKDDQNQAALFSVGHAIDLWKPRVVTMEETNGIFHRQHEQDFRSLIQMFTDRAYSVSWREDNATEHDVPSERKRLILRASCPGQRLPAHPAPTSGPRTQQPKKTVNDYICHLDHRLHTHHDPDFTLRRRNDFLGLGDLPLTNIITCGGTLDSHPCGGPWTIRELASLTTLSDDFIFPSRLTKTQMRTQIGNMVPAKVAEALMRSVKTCLLEDNRRIRQSIAERLELTKVQDIGLSAANPMEIDSDDGDGDDDDSESVASDITVGRDR